jgi:predicted polyphosphate/ATP-dependent NAD kinase
MNKNVKEITNRLGLKYDHINHLYSKKAYIASEKEMQKFAEAIVTECAGIYEAIVNGNTVEGTSTYLTAIKRRLMEDAK